MVTSQLLTFITSGLVDCGDYVVVTNARKIRVTGNKEKQIIYRHHTMYPGGLKEKSYRDLMAQRPEEVRVARIATFQQFQ